MEENKQPPLHHGFIEIQGSESDIIQFTDVSSNGKIKMEKHTKSLPKTLVKLTEKNLKKYSTWHYSFF